MTRKKYTNSILAGNNNGGLHSTRKLNTVQQFFNTHDLKKAILYQFILSGSDRTEYQATLKALMRHIRTKCRAEYIGAYEVGEEKGGIHAHAFVLVETAKHFPSDLLDVSEGQFIARRIKRRKLSIRIEPPKNPMHGGAMFAKMNTPAKLADCLKWATYFLKVRSKEDVTDRETYFGSEFLSNIAKREAKRQKYRDALTKSSKSTPEKEATMTPAERYVATRYEEAVAQQLDVEAIRLFLLSEGIPRTPGQVVYDLDERFGFYGYAASHPAPAKRTYAEIDAALDREKPSKVDRSPSRTDRLLTNGSATMKELAELQQLESNASIHRIGSDISSLEGDCIASARQDAILSSKPPTKSLSASVRPSVKQSLMLY